MQKREKNVQKSMVHVQSCCFANQAYCFFFFFFSLPSAPLDLKVPILAAKRGSRCHLTTSFSENVEVAATSNQMLEVLPFFDLERV